MENAYTLKEFISDLDRISGEEREPARVTCGCVDAAPCT